MNDRGTGKAKVGGNKESDGMRVWFKMCAGSKEGAETVWQS